VLALLRPVLSPTMSSFRRFALAGIIANTVILSTGAAVRLSSSGLGCPDWPRCSKADIVASHNAGQTLLNTWIEFGNRLLNFPLVAITALVFIVAWRLTRQPGPYQGRRDLLWLAAIQPLGVVAQAVIGGIVVLTKLNPATVSVHFLLSASLVAASVLLYARCTVFPADEVGQIRPELRVLSAILVCITAVMLAAGTVVTGTGPLAGHADTPRYHLPLEGVTQLHADIGWLMGGITVALVLGLRVSAAGPRAMRMGWIVVVGLFVQGTLGYVQYFNHLPAGLVWVHVTTAVMLWIAVLWLFFTLSNGTFIVQQQVTIPQREPETADR
jgi:heme a synthase